MKQREDFGLGNSFPGARTLAQVICESYNTAGVAFTPF